MGGSWQALVFTLVQGMPMWAELHTRTWSDTSLQGLATVAGMVPCSAHHICCVTASAFLVQHAPPGCWPVTAVAFYGKG